MHTGGFRKGLIIGGLIGASIGMMMGPEVMNSRTRKKMMRSGRNMLRRSGNIISDVIELFR
ncbi:MAG TPA: YtxH domain-containing protein [Clostridiaceae bacterium]|nr:YtxH domain-containing protein [Clostridiaceae bacterium]